MKASRTVFLVCISLFLQCLSCNIPSYLLPLKEGQDILLSERYWKPPFQNNFSSMLFKANMRYGERFDLGGLLALKQVKKDNFRAIFMTVSGTTLFDFEFGQQGLVIHQLLRAMDRKILLKIIEQDFYMLLANHLNGQKATLFNKGKQVLLKTRHKQHNLYFVQEHKQRIIRVHQDRKVSLQFSDFLDNSPRTIEIQHHNLPLNLVLKRLK